MVQIRTYQPQDADAIADLYHAAVHAIDPTVYSKEQQEAWAPTPPDKVFWKERLAQKQPFVAWREGRIVGFMELEADGHIDCAYTHPAFQGRAWRRPCMRIWKRMPAKRAWHACMWKLRI